jgi:hypothetical protein
LAPAGAAAAEFDRVIQLLAADLAAHPVPGLRVVPVESESQPDGTLVAWCRDAEGNAAGILLPPGVTGAEATVAIAEQVQDAAVESEWTDGRPTAWPPCPLHPRRHPLEPLLALGAAVWSCPVAGSVVAPIGALSG